MLALLPLWFRLLAYAPSHIGTLTQGGALRLYLILWWNQWGSFFLDLLASWFRLLACAPSHIGTLTQGGALRKSANNYFDT
ncbi:hypothetical protein PROCOU_10948 [Listeria rocourtiae FSL F6-920]|nr:hypothetical protein PROCOU_10948 [Listeria rocourtiae FSL F6-920]